MAAGPCSWNSFNGNTTCDPYSYMGCTPNNYMPPWYQPAYQAPPMWTPPQGPPAANPFNCPCCGTQQFPPRPTAPAAAPAPNKPSTAKPTAFPGVEVLYPRQTTMIRIPKGGAKPWKAAPGSSIPYVTYKVGTDVTLAQLCGLLGHNPKKTKITEAVEVGNTTWSKGLGGAVADKKDKTIADMGWDKGNMGPTWLAVRVKP